MRVFLMAGEEGARETLGRVFRFCQCAIVVAHRIGGCLRALVFVA